MAKEDSIGKQYIEVSKHNNSLSKFAKDIEYCAFGNRALNSASRIRIRKL